MFSQHVLDFLSPTDTEKKKENPNSTPASQAIPISSAVISHLSAAAPEEEDTATSPGYRAPGKHAVSRPQARRMTNVVQIPDDIKENVSFEKTAGVLRRPKRAASDGVSGAIAAARSDWGLDRRSPPRKREPVDGQNQGPYNTCSRDDRNAMLKRALGPNNSQSRMHQEDEADAISALVSLNSMG